MAMLLCNCICAQITIGGTIQDEHQTPIPYVNVIVYKQLDTTLVKGSITDTSGRFTIELNPGDYKVVFSSIGYGTETFLVSESKEFGIITLGTQLEELEGVTIVANKPLLQIKKDKLVVNVAGNATSLGNSVVEVLQKAPGVMVDQNTTVLLNGRSGVRIFIDGKDTRLNGSELGNLLQNMSSANIDKIEIISNPSAQFEAQGNAGIINILTKQGKLFGTNAGFSTAFGSGRYFRWEKSLNFNHRSEKLNLYGQYTLAKRDEWLRVDIDRTFLNENREIISNIELNNVFKLPIEIHTPRLGLDYEVNNHLSFGFLFSGIFNNEEQNAINNINGFNGNGEQILNQITNTENTSNWTNLTGNFNLKYTFENKSFLDFDIDVAKYINKLDQRFHTSFFALDNDVLDSTVLIGDIDGGLKLFGLSVDYEYTPEEGKTLKAGYKSVSARTNNEVKYFGFMDANILDSNLVNLFQYDESIHSTYLSYFLGGEKWSFDFGLRGEYTDIKGVQKTINETFNINYFSLFPSLSITHSLNENNRLGFSVGRRIDRPIYYQLNPFPLFIDTNTFRIGNPLLRPQFTWSTQANYTIRNKYFIAISFAITEDFISEGALQNGNNEEVLLQPINIDRVKNVALTLSVPLEIDSWLQSNISLNASLNRFEGQISGSQLDRSTPITNLSSNHSFILGNGYELELSTFHLFSHFSGITELETISSVSIGGKKSFLDGRATISLNINDIFWNQYPVGRTDFAGLIDNFRSYQDSRYVMLALNYKFGKQSIRSEKKRDSEIGKEMKRARQQRN